MPKQNLKSENENIVYDELINSLKQKIRFGRESRLIIAELLIILGAALALGLTHTISPELAGGGFLALYVAECFSVFMNEQSLGHNIFLELPKFVYSIRCPRKHSNAKKNAETKPLNEKAEKNAETKPLNEKNAKEAPTSTYGTIPRQISQTSTLSNGTNSSLPENQLSLSVMPTISSLSTESSSHTIDISSAEIDEISQVSGDNNLIYATFS